MGVCCVLCTAEHTETKAKDYRLISPRCANNGPTKSRARRMITNVKDNVARSKVHDIRSHGLYVFPFLRETSQIPPTPHSLFFFVYLRICFFLSGVIVSFRFFFLHLDSCYDLPHGFSHATSSISASQ